MSLPEDALFVALPDPCLLVETSGWRVQAANPAAEHYFAQPAAQLCGQTVPALLPDLQSQLGALLLTGPQTVQCRGQGPWSWVGVRSYPVGDQRMIQFFDVTAHRASEARSTALVTLTTALSQALSVAEIAAVVLAQGLRALDAVSGSVFVLDSADQQLRLVGAAGYEPDFLSHWQRVPVGSATLVSEVLHSGPQLALVTDLDQRYPLYGARRSVPSTAVAALPLIFAGRPLGVVTFGFTRAELSAPEDRLMNVLAEQLAQALERVRLLAEERHAREQYRALIEATQQYAWTNSPEGEMTGEQPGWARLTGQSPAAYQGHGWAEMLHPDDRDHAVAAWQTAVRARSPYAADQRVRGQDGQYRHFLVRAIPLIADDGQLLEWVGLHTDVTPLKQAEQALRGWGQELERRVTAQTHELRIANEELGAFAYSVSHDLRTPVRHVLSFAELLRGAVNDDPRARRHLEIVVQAGQRMETLIVALLDLARLGAATLQRRDLDLAQLVAAARADLAPDLVGRAISWQLGNLPPVWADEALLGQVLVNLLGNAVKYSRGRSPAVIEVWAELQGDEVVVSVRDNGAGFDPRYQQRLFGVFQRLHSEREFEGTGVGLANVRRIIEKHGGRVWAAGQPGAGATFSFSLPRP